MVKVLIFDFNVWCLYMLYHLVKLKSIIQIQPEFVWMYSRECMCPILSTQNLSVMPVCLICLKLYSCSWSTCQQI